MKKREDLRKQFGFIEPYNSGGRNRFIEQDRANEWESYALRLEDELIKIFGQLGKEVK